MNRYLFSMIAVLLLGLTVSFLYQHHSIAAIRAHLPGTHVAVPPMALQAQCGCTVDTDEHFPTTPQEVQQAKAKEKREEAEGELLDKQTDNRVRRLIRVGMLRKQVEQIMGPASMMGTPDVIVKGHPSDDADFYSDYQIAYTAKDTVASISYDAP